MSWDQPLCERCWIDEHTVRIAGGVEIRRPVRLTEPDVEVCCQCGKLTLAGIYVRRDPTTVVFPRRGGDA